MIDKEFEMSEFELKKWLGEKEFHEITDGLTAARNVVDVINIKEDIHTRIIKVSKDTYLIRQGEPPFVYAGISDYIKNDLEIAQEQLWKIYTEKSKKLKEMYNGK